MLGFIVLIGSFHLFLNIYIYIYTHIYFIFIGGVVYSFRTCFKYKSGFTQKTTNVLYTQDEELMLFWIYVLHRNEFLSKTYFIEKQISEFRYFKIDTNMIQYKFEMS